MPLISTVYCTQAEMVRRFGSAGITAFSDHDGDDVIDTDVVEDAINQAAQEIELYATQRYSRAGLTASTLINRWAVTMACYFLCQNRGNPPPDSLAEEFTRIMEALAKVATGELQLPGVALRSDMRPTFDNLTVERRYQQAKVRVQKEVSSDAPTVLQENLADYPSARSL